MKILIVRLFPDELNINNYNVQEIGLAKALVKKGHVCDIVLYTNKKENYIQEIEIDKKTNTLVKLQGEIDILTVDTRNKDRDKHLLGDEYFDAGNYPKGILKMTKFSKEKNGIKVEADLTLRGITKKVVLRGDLKGPVQNPMNKKEIFGLSLEGTINRKDFNIGKDTSGATMGEEVEISINLELTAK